MMITTHPSLTDEMTRLLQQLPPAQQHVLLVYLRVLVAQQQPHAPVVCYDDTSETPVAVHTGTTLISLDQDHLTRASRLVTVQTPAQVLATLRQSS